MTEQILVVPTQKFHDLGVFQGFTVDWKKYLPTLLDPANLQFMPRPEMEQDPSYKQLIPYVIFGYTAGDEVLVFAYRRAAKGGDVRLQKKRSIGVGGHINPVDGHPHENPFTVGLEREIQEEVTATKYYLSQLGLINDDSNEVGKVHLGVAYLAELPEPVLESKDKDLVEAGFFPLSQLIAEKDQFENWSQICLEMLTANHSTVKV